jgi:hypothetical protein
MRAPGRGESQASPRRHFQNRHGTSGESTGIRWITPSNGRLPYPSDKTFDLLPKRVVPGGVVGFLKVELALQPDEQIAGDAKAELDAQRH